MDAPQLLHVTLIDEPNGLLTINERLPFVPVRVFSITGVPAGERRGGHWHRWCHQVIWCVSGGVNVKTAGDQELVYPMGPGSMLHVPPLHMIDLSGFVEGDVVVVLCSEKYTKPETSLELLKEERLIRFAVEEVIKHEDAETGSRAVKKNWRGETLLDGDVRFGPKDVEPSPEEIKDAASKILDKFRQDETGPRVTSDHNDPRLRKTRADGQQEAYFVLSEEERAKGFVKPVFRKYVHVKCGTETVMSLAIAESYSRSPATYSGTFCVHCGRHFDLRNADGSFAFMWPDGTGVGSFPDVDLDA